MREVKFRAIDRNSGKWVYGIPFTFKENNFTDFEAMHVCDSTGYWRIIQIIPDTVGQYIGLKDRNGKEIFEGDIVKWFGYEVKSGRQVRPERTMCINDYVKDTYRIFCITENTGQTVEIIGNIHENPELLEGR